MGAARRRRRSERTALEAAIRELSEETSINLASSALQAAYLSLPMVFSDPARDLRSHIITHVHRFVLLAGIDVVVSAADDDAKEAAWFTDFNGLASYADHHQLIAEMASGASAAS
ncbi:NUDIX domain-containing protein [Oryzicola mucosus]|uniref:NUDIX hydrolase n=1 Tax=Oryzicola mucosus TaxID=2767425 RepID=A0A8J6Q552_9HYPH|nr:NUDIX hydrolase [Oryzicola mucosus]